MARRKYDGADRHNDSVLTSPSESRCPTGKHSYPSKKVIKQEYRRKGLMNRRFYRCAECDGFHATGMKYMQQVEAGLIPADQ